MTTMRTFMTLVTEGVDVSSEAFLRWFAGSKIVDQQGDPLKLYRGLHGPYVQTVDRMEPRSGYAAFFTTSPHVAASYANPDFDFPDSTGAIFPVYIKADVLYEFPVRDGPYGRSFDFFAFDRRAKSLRPGEALVVRKVNDIGPRANTKVDPKKLYSYAADIYAIGQGTSVKSAISNTAFSDSPVMTETKKSPKAVAYKIVRFDGPKNVSGKIIDSTLIYASTKAERDQKIKAWMEEIGLDPEDEDDQTYVDIALD
jgi:hypothetical protein